LIGGFVRAVAAAEGFAYGIDVFVEVVDDGLG
jgi:hypothetical protein